MKTLLMLTLLVGCGSSPDCKNGTVLVHLTLAGAALNADTLEMVVGDADGPERVSEITHRPGDASGAIEVDFPEFPVGQTRSFTVRALQGGETLAQASASFVISDLCDVAVLHLDDASK